jgi:imidazolonepropionase-like amidohydrolase
MSPRTALPFLLLIAAVAAQRPQWRLQPGQYVVRHVDVLTMESPELLRDRDVQITDGVIRAIAPAAEVAPTGIAIDGRGLTLLPGLVDMHVHLNDEEREQQLGLYLAHGVTTVQSMHGTPRHLEVRARLARGDLIGPRFFTTGPTTATEQVNSPARAAEVVQAQADAGFDAIKMYGDGSDTMTRETYAALVAAAHARGLRLVGHAPRNLPFEVVLAEGQDSIDHMEEILYTSTPVLKVMAPLVRFQFGRRNREEVEQLLRQGDLDARMEAAAKEVAAQVAATKLAVTPTLIAFTTILQHTTPEFESLADNPLLACMSPLTRRQWEPSRNRYRRFWSDRRDVISLVLAQGLAMQKRLVRGFHAAGVPILTGTDAPLTFVYPGWSLHRELALLVGCGLSPYDALVAATVAPARVLGIADRIGTVAIGKEADLVLVRGDPTADVVNAAKIASVFARGRWLDRSALDALLRDLAASYAPVAAQLRQIEAPLDAGDFAGVAKAFAAIGQPDPLLATFVENEMNEQGYRLLKSGKVDEAIVQFERARDLFPRSFNTWDSLGEAWMTRGDKDKAIACYEKSLELNPANANGTAMLKRLRER